MLGAVAIAAAGALVGSQFSTPAQQAADARAPQASLVTMPVQRGRLRVTVTFRADLSDANSVSIPVPTSLDGSIPIVTALGAADHGEVSSGQVVAGVAGRPVIVLRGQIPAYRTMTLGDKGVDVAQLQTALHGAGYPLGADSFGTFGLGTAAAVKTMYARLGYPAIMTAVAAIAPPATAKRAKSAGRAPSAVATVPLGEVAFLPTLPARLTQLDVRLGGRARGTVGSVGSGDLRLSGTVAEADAPRLAAGQIGAATSDLTGKSIRVRIVHVRLPKVSAATGSGQPPDERVVLAPIGRVPPSLVGQNLRVSIDTVSTRGRSWIVPVAAVVTSADGRSFVIVEDQRGREHEVPVRPGLVSAGHQAVSPVGASLAAGEPVVIGAGAAQ
jgi:hypothetical protein